MNIRHLTSIVMALLLSLPLLLSSLYGQQIKSTQKVIFGFYPSDRPTVVYKKFKPFVSYLEEEVNKRLKGKITYKFEVVITKSYQDHLDQMAQGKVEISRLGPASYVLLKRKVPNLKLLAVENKKGKKTFNGHIIAYKDSPIKTIKDLSKMKGEISFAFGNKNSTLGRYFPQALLAKNGFNQSYFKKSKFLARHDKVASAVVAGDYGLGSIKNGTYKKYRKRGLISIAKMKNITKPWVSHPKVSPQLLATIQAVMFDQKAKSKRRKKAYKKLKVKGFFAAEDKEFTFVREKMELALKFERN